jgi:hypothetical protein
MSLSTLRLTLGLGTTGAPQYKIVHGVPTNGCTDEELEDFQATLGLLVKCETANWFTVDTGCAPKRASISRVVQTANCACQGGGVLTVEFKPPSPEPRISLPDSSSSRSAGLSSRSAGSGMCDDGIIPSTAHLQHCLQMYVPKEADGKFISYMKAKLQHPDSLSGAITLLKQELLREDGTLHPNGKSRYLRRRISKYIHQFNTNQDVRNAARVEATLALELATAEGPLLLESRQAVESELLNGAVTGVGVTGVGKKPLAEVSLKIVKPPPARTPIGSFVWAPVSDDEDEGVGGGTEEAP